MMRKLWLLAGCAGSALTLASPALAEVPGVAALVEQGRYWQGKGRQDLANQAFRRALALDPANSAARQGLSGPPRRAAPAKPTPAPKPAAQPGQRREPTRTATPAPTRAPAQTASPRPAQPASGPRGGAARAAGFDALEAGRLAEAERDFQRAIAANARDADAQGGLGLVRLRQGNFAEARSRLEQASSLGNASQWAEALGSARFFAGLSEARAALAQNRLPEAQRIAEELMRSGYADRAPAVELLASIYERQGRFADAADLYRQAKEGAGGAGGRGDVRLAARAARARAMAAASSGDEMAAEQAFHSGLLLDQKDPWIRLEFARYLLARGRAPEVESLLSSLSGSSDPDWLYAGALLNGELGRSAAAETLINRIPDGQRTEQMRNFAVGLKVDAAVERARALGAQGGGLAAIRQLAATPGLGAARQASLADALYELGDREGAAALAQQAMAGEISDPAVYEPIVRVLAKTGRDAFAMAAIQRAGDLAGSSPEGQRTMARMNGIMAASQADRLRQAGQNAAAFDQLQAAWNAAPGDREVLAALARLYQSGGMPAQAAQTYQMVLAQTPDDKGALMGLIETAGAAGDRDLARRTIDRALQVAPNDHEIYMAAARMERARGDEGAALRYLKRAQALYARRSGQGMTLTSANPFGAAQMSDNPFRNQQAAAQAPMANPFALRGGARLPATSVPIAQDGGYPSPTQSYPAYGAPIGGGAIPSYGAPPGTVTGTGVAAPPPAYGGTGYEGQAYAAPGNAPIGDPVLGRIQSEINELARESGPRAELRTGYRERSGEVGLSALKELSGTAEISTGLGNGRVSGKAHAVVLDSGRPTGSGLARFGRNATPEAEGIVDEQPSDLAQAKTQHAAGVAVSLAYETPLLKVELGTTPLGFEDTEVTWQAAVTPR
ncbi:MAG: tetratricopeptide repeat protein, partial [Sphingobium sp.]